MLWFWLVFAVVFSVNIFVSQMNSENSRFRPIPPHLFEQLDNTRIKLEYLLEQEKSRNKRSRRHFLRNTFLLNDEGQDYFGKRTPGLLSELHHRILDEKKPLTGVKKRLLYFGGVKVHHKGEGYRLYLTQRFSVLSSGYLGFFIREFALNLLFSTFLVSFPVSFLLAWVFTRPIRRLQLAITEMSDDLKNKKSLQKLTGRQDEFGDLAKDFESMASHVEKIIASKNRLIGDVSHELRTPLARLQIAIGLANKKSPEKLKKELARIKLEADRMNQMISSLLDYAKSDDAAFEPKIEQFDLAKLIIVIVKDLEFEAQQQQITITTDITEDFLFSGEQSSVVSCIENILRNALRYAETSIKILAFLDAEKRNISILIEDDGCGVPEEQLEKIFDAFYRPQSDRSRDSGGAGLGLSIAKKIVVAHKGEISATNISPHGLKIEIYFPSK
ncbi:MAG: HAMP domain-containing protein [Kangiellaceae bacterium]|nr:HAMP domain-containing protein [Kangiellaceae bacterium]